ncbi:ABC transporter permease [Polycladidibacter hongkongensis]|uniref:ABC transporter permease n=1 Tax=Polycladidibacter hongkongensis TaxID=1647556 RepID=UPI000AB20E61|nr:ABC transporter permease [Pseudovibrio hongkongensis]
MIGALDKKVLRDLRRLWPQVLAIGLVMACGVMTLLMASGSYRSLRETQLVYYDQYRFADVFAKVVRAPNVLLPQMREIAGVAAVEGRISTGAILEMEGMSEPASGVAVSLPAGADASVNKLYVREGRLPQAHSTNEVAIDHRFAVAHGLRMGDHFSAIIHGRRVTLEVTGLVLSPEFIYAIGPSDLVPDARRFGVLFLSHHALEGLVDLEGAFNDAAIRLSRGACVPCVMRQVDLLLRDYGGTGAFGRTDQTSHAFLDSELTQLEGMARILPPVFLLVAAYLVNMILSRMIALEREQIGLLKACGYTSWQVAGHYAKLVLAIALLGSLLGSVAGNWVGRGLTQMYSAYFSFPFLVFKQSPDLYVLAIGVCSGAALAGAGRAIFKAAQLPPAVAMRAPVPERFRGVLSLRAKQGGLSKLSVMGLRHLLHHPVRAAMTMVGIAFAASLAVTALSMVGSLDYMVELALYRAERADARLQLVEDQRGDVLHEIARLPAVRKVEAYRNEPVVYRANGKVKRGSITGKPLGAQLSRTLGVDKLPMALPAAGLILPTRLAGFLGVVPGQLVEVAFTRFGGRTRELRVAGVSSSFVGIAGVMRLDALHRAVGEGERLNDVAVMADPLALDALYSEIKQTPGLGGIALQSLSRRKFRANMDQNMGTMISAYFLVAMIVAFGVVYNSFRIQLSERGRELASLRVLGFSSAEVFQVMLVEMGVIVVLSLPLGWLLGFGFAAMVVKGIESDLFALPLVVNADAYAYAALVIIASSLLCGGVIWRRVARLDLIATLKARE